MKWADIYSRLFINLPYYPTFSIIRSSFSSVYVEKSDSAVVQLFYYTTITLDIVRWLVYINTKTFPELFLLPLTSD
jgi:hypothetical protein